MGLITLSAVAVVAIPAFIKSNRPINKAAVLLIYGITAVVYAGLV